MNAQPTVDNWGLAAYLAELLNVDQIKDHCPNGLQVEGKAKIGKLVTGVTASKDFIEQAIAAQADAILVHHGWFWQGEDPCITGVKWRRLQPLVDARVNLFAYHLPLDLHPLYGNNAQFGALLGAQQVRPLAHVDDLVLRGELPQPRTLAQIREQLTRLLDFTPLLLGDAERLVHKISWCTGAAMREFPRTLATDLELFISGEINEPTAHLALESGVAYMAAGHHATERLGVQALGEHLAKRFALTHQFIDCPVPV